MGTYAKWKVPILTALILSFFAFLLPIMTVNADVGEIEYEDNGLTRTENDGVGEDGDGNEDGGLLDWLVGVGDGIDNAIEEAGDFFGPAIDAVGEAWDWTTDKVSDGWDWTKEHVSEGWDNFTNWTSDVWDATPDWVKSSLAFVGVAAAVVGIAVVGVISAPVAAVAIIGAGIAGGLYYAFNGGEDSYSFLGALGWTLGGAIAGGVGQATGALAAGFNAARVFLGRKLASGLLSFSIHRGIQGGTLGLLRHVGGMWLKAAATPTIAVTLFNGINMYANNSFDFGKLAWEAGLTFVSSGLGFGLIRSIRSSYSGLRSLPKLLSPVLGTAVVGGAGNVLLQQFTEGSSNFTDFTVGAGVATGFIVSDILISKIGNPVLESGYEVTKKAIGDWVSDLFNDKPNTGKTSAGK